MSFDQSGTCDTSTLPDYLAHEHPIQVPSVASAHLQLPAPQPSLEPCLQWKAAVSLADSLPPSLTKPLRSGHAHQGGPYLKDHPREPGNQYKYHCVQTIFKGH